MYFVGGRVFFRCREDTYAEHCVDHSHHLRTPPPGEGDPWQHGDRSSSSLLPKAIALKRPLFDFGRLLKGYTLRALTLDSDILPALAGITRRVSQKARCQFFEGMPAVAFDAFIIFQPKDENTVLRRRRGLPSYSWAGWKGGVVIGTKEVFDYMNRWLECCTWIIWYKRDSSGLNLVWDPSENKDFPMEDMSYPGYRLRRSFRSPPGVSLDSRQTCPTQDVAVELLKKTGYPLLQFWTVSVHFQMEIVDEMRGVADIVTPKEMEDKFGRIYLDGIGDSSIFTTKDSFEFILLSLRPSNWDLQLSAPDRLSSLLYYHVMLIEWNGPVAERRGFGRLIKTALAHSLPPGPQWKEIILG